MDEEKDFKLSKTDSVDEKHADHEVSEGGWGWVICGGTFIVNFIVFGIHNSFGVIYANLLDELKLGKAETAWIGAMAIGLNFLFGPLTSMLCDRYSCRMTAFVGALLSVLGLFLTSFVQRPSKMYLTYGLLFGVGSSFSFVSSIVILGEYFKKRLPLVNGIATSGSGVGSLVAGPVINFLLENTGWQNCMRVLSGFAMLLWVAAALYRPNKDRAATNKDRAATNKDPAATNTDWAATNTDRATNNTDHAATNTDRAATDKDPAATSTDRGRASRLFDTTIWKNKAYVLWVVTVALFQFGYLFPFVHLIKYAEELGIAKSKGAWLIGFLSIMSTVGRLLFGKLCDIKRVNRIQVYQFSVFVIGISTLLCPLATTYAGLVGYAMTFGFFDGCFVGQVAVITADIVGHEKLSQGVGNMFGFIAIPMSLGPPVAGWLYDAFGTYDLSFYLSGGIAVASSFLVFAVSYMRKQSTPLSTKYLGRKSISVTNDAERNDEDFKRDSSGYSSRDSAFENEPLVAPDGTKEQYISGAKLRDLFNDLEKETVI